MKKRNLLFLALVTTVLFFACQKIEDTNPRTDTTTTNTNTTTTVKDNTVVPSDSAIALATSVPTNTNGTTSVSKNSDGTVTKTISQTLGTGTTQKFVNVIDKKGQVSSTISTGSVTTAASGFVREDGSILLNSSTLPTGVTSLITVVEPDNSNITFTTLADGSKLQTNVQSDGSVINFIIDSKGETTGVSLTRPDGTIVNDTTIAPAIPPVTIPGGGTPIDTTVIIPVDTSVTTPIDTNTTPTDTTVVNPVEPGETPIPDCGKLSHMSNTFLPLTPGTFWEYDSQINTLYSDKITEDGITYLLARDNNGTEAYYGYGSGDFYIYYKSLGFKIIILKDDMKPGDTWDNNVMVNGVPTNYNMLVEEVGIERVVNGFTYKNVVKIKSTTSFDILGTESATVLYYYYAKNIGLIQTTDENGAVQAGSAIKCFNIAAAGQTFPAPDNEGGTPGIGVSSGKFNVTQNGVSKEATILTSTLTKTFENGEAARLLEIKVNVDGGTLAIGISNWDFFQFPSSNGVASKQYFVNTNKSACKEQNGITYCDEMVGSYTLLPNIYFTPFFEDTTNSNVTITNVDNENLKVSGLFDFHVISLEDGKSLHFKGDFSDLTYTVQ